MWTQVKRPSISIKVVSPFLYRGRFDDNTLELEEADGSLNGTLDHEPSSCFVQGTAHGSRDTRGGQSRSTFGRSTHFPARQQYWPQAQPYSHLPGPFRHIHHSRNRCFCHTYKGDNLEPKYYRDGRTDSLDQGASAIPTLREEPVPVDLPLKEKPPGKHPDPEAQPDDEIEQPEETEQVEGRTAGEKNVLIVDWKGPDDPQNPQK